MTPYASPEHSPALDMIPSIGALSPQSPVLETPSLDRDNIEHLLDPDVQPVAVAPGSAEEEGYDTSSLTSKDVRSDPILSSLAAKQVHPQGALSPTRSNEGDGGFKARPAPASTRQDGLGPRMTKAAALRVGLGSEERAKKSSGASEATAAAAAAPGYKRVGLGITVPSLAEPTIVPKQTKSSQLRAAGQEGSGLWSDPSRSTAVAEEREAAIVAHKEKERLGRLERRKSLAGHVASLAQPLVQVKQTRASQLRAAGEPGGDLWRQAGGDDEKRDREALALANKARDKREREERRKTMSTPLASLGQPSILPRGNKTSQLRAAGETGTGLWRVPGKEMRSDQGARERREAAMLSKERERAERLPRRKSMASPASLATPSITPRPNKTSLLRHTSHQSISTMPERSQSLASLTVPLTRTTTALKATSADNVEASSSSASASASNRRASVVGVKSLGAPSIQPRLNRAAMLRQPQAQAQAEAQSRPHPPSSFPSSESVLQTQSRTPGQGHRKAASVSTSTPFTGPRPTKASLLRAQMGKIMPKIGS